MKKLEHKVFFINDWRVSPSEGLLTRGNEIKRLEPKVMEVLVYFASRPGEVITREELENDVWHGALIGYDAVTNTVIKLRKALQDNARQPHFIVTVPKKGYQLIASIQYHEDDNFSESVAQISNEQLTKTQIKRPSMTAHWIGLAVLMTILIFGLLWLWPSVTDKNNLVQPSIVVLPFENLSDDPEQKYLADGITEDIITDLSRLSNLLVIASNTSSTFKGKQVLPEKIGADLNVKFVLKGSLRLFENTVRVNAQLIDATAGTNIWAQRYDRKISEVFAVQDEVTHSIVKALAVKVTNQEKQRLTQQKTSSLEAYDFFQEGQRIFKISTKETNEQARAMYRKTIELDPGYGRAYGALAVTFAIDFRRGWTDSPVETLDRALELAKKAVTLDGSTPQTYWALGFVYLTRKEYDNAEKTVAQAISIAPNYADGYSLLALINSFLGQAEKSITLSNKAIRLNPYYSYEYLISYGMAYYQLGDYDSAIKALEQAQERNEFAIQIKVLLAASYVGADRQNDAEWVVSKLRALSPVTTITALEKTIPFAKLELKHALLEDLRKAGLPE